MSSWREFKEYQDFDKIREALEGGMIYIHRPLILHERAPEANRKKCPCGCDSVFAQAVETIEHIDILIDPVTGIRRVLQKCPDEESKAKWLELSKQARRFDLPHRISKKQLAVLRFLERGGAKVFAVFGGIRAGKSTFIADTILTAALMWGGTGQQVWWVAPTQAKTQIGLNKLALGEVIGKGKKQRRAKPLIPPELLAYKPSSTKAERAYVELIDGTRIFFKYASANGGNLKGESPVLAIGDEFAEVKHEQNYDELNRRLTEGDGQLLISTTPVAGHWLETSVYEAGVSLESATPDDLIVWANITAFDNPWFSIPNIEKEIARCRKTGGELSVRREIYGEWVSSGPRLWHHFNEADHILSDASYRVPSDLGLVDATREKTSRFLRGQQADRYLGMDFNLWPMSNVEIQIAYHPSDSLKTPIVIVPDEEVRKVGSILEHIQNLKRRGFAGAGISCDATGAQPGNGYALSHGVKDKNSTQAIEMRKAGFICQPCRIGSGGSPSNPAQLDKISPLHRLMMERIQLPDGTSFPRFLIHERAAKTLQSIRTQEADARGNPAKEPGQASDRLSGPTDALCYGLFPLERELFPDLKPGTAFGFDH